MKLTKIFKNFLRLFPFNQNYSRIIYETFYKKVLKDNLIRDYRPSIVYSLDNTNISKKLVNLTTKSVSIAVKKKLKFGNENLFDFKFLNEFPGEHYRIINALVKIIKPKHVVEIGTYTGLGTLSLKESAPKNCKITTYDVVKWNNLDVGSHLNNNHFKNNKFKQIIGDLSDDNFFKKNKKILNTAEIIFLDAPKDNIFEYNFMKKITTLDKKKDKILIIDDIKFINMIDLWRKINSPKIDITSFGHWSGTGLVDISEGLKLK